MLGFGVAKKGSFFQPQNTKVNPTKLNIPFFVGGHRTPPILSENVPPLLKDTKNDEASVSRRGLPQCRKRSSTDDRGKMCSELLVLGNGIWLFG